MEYWNFDSINDLVQISPENDEKLLILKYTESVDVNNEQFLLDFVGGVCFGKFSHKLAILAAKTFVNVENFQKNNL